MKRGRAPGGQAGDVFFPRCSVRKLRQLGRADARTRSTALSREKLRPQASIARVCRAGPPPLHTPLCACARVPFDAPSPLSLPLYSPLATAGWPWTARPRMGPAWSPWRCECEWWVRARWGVAKGALWCEGKWEEVRGGVSFRTCRREAGAPTFHPHTGPGQAAALVRGLRWSGRRKPRAATPPPVPKSGGPRAAPFFFFSAVERVLSQGKGRGRTSLVPARSEGQVLNLHAGACRMGGRRELARLGGRPKSGSRSNNKNGSPRRRLCGCRKRVPQGGRAPQLGPAGRTCGCRCPHTAGVG